MKTSETIGKICLMWVIQALGELVSGWNCPGRLLNSRAAG